MATIMCCYVCGAFVQREGCRGASNENCDKVTCKVCSADIDRKHQGVFAPLSEGGTIGVCFYLATPWEDTANRLRGKTPPSASAQSQISPRPPNKAEKTDNTAAEQARELAFFRASTPDNCPKCGAPHPCCYHPEDSHIQPAYFWRQGEV